MELKAYERVKFATNLRQLLIKSECENCGESEKLELHHDKQFAEMLREVLDRLGYEYKPRKEDYTKEQLENITDMLLGIHIKSTYTTLCEKCHTEIHSKGELITHFLRKVKIIDIEDIRMLKEYLDSIIGIKLFATEQEGLSKVIIGLKTISRNTDYRTTTIKPTTLENILRDQLDLPYVVSKSEKETKGYMRGKRYIIITKVVD